MEHSNSRTFQGLTRTFKGLQFFCQNSRTSQGPYEPCNMVRASNDKVGFWAQVDNCNLT